MWFSNEAILWQMKTHFWWLEKWILLMKNWYPSIPDDIDKILNMSKSFPEQHESSTGLQLLNREWNWPYTNEEWQRIILAPHYPLPIEYKKDSRSLDSVDASLEIQSNILNSTSYQRYISKIDTLPELTKDNAIWTPRYKWIREILPSFNLDSFESNQHIWFCLHQTKKRIKQCIYSIEEQKFKDQIIKLIWNPIQEVYQEVKTRIADWESFE